jgi:hypothetical protein
MPNSAISFNTSGLATTTSPGLVGTGAQTFAGAKTFQNGLVSNTITAATSSGITINENDGSAIATVDDTGSWTFGRVAANQSHKLNGEIKQIFRQYSGGATRTLSTTPDLFMGQSVFVDSFTDLSTTFFSVANGLALTSGRLDCVLSVTNGCTASFTVYLALQSGVAWRFHSFSAGNCTITEPSEGTFNIVVGGDARTYTLAFNTNNSSASISASSTATGITLLKMMLTY